MTIYYTSLRLYAKAYKAVQFYCFQMALAFGLGNAIARIKEAENVAMAKNAEMLISNISKCQYAFELKACMDTYQVLCLSYPEFPLLYNKVVTDAINRRTEIIKQSFNQ